MSDERVVVPGRLLMLIGAALSVIAAERLLSARLLGFVPDNAVSIRLATSLICGGLAPLVFAIGYFKVKQGKKRPAPDDR